MIPLIRFDFDESRYGNEGGFRLVANAILDSLALVMSALRSDLPLLMRINAKHEVTIELEKFLKKSLQILGKLVIIDELTKQRAVTSAG